MTDITNGPVFTYGDLTKIPASLSPTAVVNDPNVDAGPSLTYQADGFLDIRFVFMKDKILGFTGSAPGHIDVPFVQTGVGIPAAVATNNIAAAQGVTSGVAMTLAGASFGVVLNVPIRTYPTSPAFYGNTAIVTVPIALDFGFTFGATTAGSATITVVDAMNFFPGMPLVIAGVGNAAGTIPLLTTVVSTNFTANTITVLSTAVPLATSTGAAIGTGDIWGPRPDVLMPLPLSAWPALAAGPALVFDARQGMQRGVQIVGSGGATGGTFTVRGYDTWNVPLTQTITVAAGASTGWSLKTFKYIASVTPNFTDAGHNYTVGTSDVFGFGYRSRIWEATDVSWAGTYTTASTGWVTADITNPATALTGDVRGTMQLSTNGGGSGVSGGTATNGSLAGITVSGRRLDMGQFLKVNDVIAGTMNNPIPIFGQTQF